MSYHYSPSQLIQQKHTLSKNSSDELLSKEGEEQLVSNLYEDLSLSVYHKDNQRVTVLLDVIQLSNIQSSSLFPSILSLMCYIFLQDWIDQQLCFSLIHLFVVSITDISSLLHTFLSVISGDFLIQINNNNESCEDDPYKESHESSCDESEIGSRKSISFEYFDSESDDFEDYSGLTVKKASNKSSSSKPISEPIRFTYYPTISANFSDSYPSNIMEKFVFLFILLFLHSPDPTTSLLILCCPFPHEKSLVFSPIQLFTRRIEGNSSFLMNLIAILLQRDVSERACAIRLCSVCLSSICPSSSVNSTPSIIQQQKSSKSGVTIIDKLLASSTSVFLSLISRCLLCDSFPLRRLCLSSLSDSIFRIILRSNEEIPDSRMILGDGTSDLFQSVVPGALSLSAILRQKKTQRSMVDQQALLRVLAKIKYPICMCSPSSSSDNIFQGLLSFVLKGCSACSKACFRETVTYVVNKRKWMHEWEQINERISVDTTILKAERDQIYALSLFDLISLHDKRQSILSQLSLAVMYCQTCLKWVTCGSLCGTASDSVYCQQKDEDFSSSIATSSVVQTHYSSSSCDLLLSVCENIIQVECCFCLLQFDGIPEWVRDEGETHKNKESHEKISKAGSEIVNIFQSESVILGRIQSIQCQLSHHISSGKVDFRSPSVSSKMEKLSSFDFGSIFGIGRKSVSESIFLDLIDNEQLWVSIGGIRDKSLGERPASMLFPKSISKESGKSDGKQAGYYLSDVSQCPCGCSVSRTPCLRQYYSHSFAPTPVLNHLEELKRSSSTKKRPFCFLSISLLPLLSFSISICNAKYGEKLIATMCALLMVSQCSILKYGCSHESKHDSHSDTKIIAASCAVIRCVLGCLNETAREAVWRSFKRSCCLSLEESRLIRQRLAYISVQK
ncbi:hypothetical protein ADUPG1_010082 [Aduncisulcus paluster]|uniref:Uncharacterized protein n=1 Tax=Aduncisulcus paluster TaxID=2918883 RepID=A0ABQ5KYZ5_9EUKA|nr:hypothetical protein ADUPG1_010082 [Aduncisulcus paluster]